MRARAHTCCMAWHGIYSIALRAQLSERLRRRSKRQPLSHMICYELHAGWEVGTAIWRFRPQRHVSRSVSESSGFIFYLTRDNICGFELFKNCAKGQNRNQVLNGKPCESRRFAWLSIYESLIPMFACLPFVIYSS